MRKILLFILTLLFSISAISFVACNNQDTPKPEELTELVLNSNNVSLKIDETFNLKVAGVSLSEVNLSSNDENVAIILQTGEIIATGVGNCIITASYKNLTTTCNVTVTEVVYYTLSLNYSTVKLSIDSQNTIIATLLRSGKDCEDEITWDIENDTENVIKYSIVDNTIEITGNVIGSATITASAQGCVSTCIVTVVEKDDPTGGHSDQIIPATFDEVDLKANIATEKDYISMFESNSNVATYSNGVKISRVANGEIAKNRAFFSKDLLKRAVDEGYTQIKLSFTAGPKFAETKVWCHIWTGTLNPEKNRGVNGFYYAQLAPDTVIDLTIDIENDLKTSDGSYQMTLYADGTNGNFFTITSFKFIKPISMDDVDLTKDLATIPEYIDILSGGFPSVGDNDFILSDCLRASQPLTYINSKLLKRAVDEGYTKVTVKLYITATGASVWTSIFGGDSNGTRPTNIIFNQSNYTEYQVLTKEITLDSTSTIKCSDGTYSLCFKALGNDKAGYEMHITSIVFSGKPAPFDIKTVDLTKDLATVPQYVKILSGDSAISVGTDGFVIGDCTHATQPLTYISSELLKRAVDEGYTKVTVKLYITATASTVWTSIFGGDWLAEKSRPTNILFNQSNYPANQELTKEITLDSTTTIKCSDGTYSLCFKSLGNDKAGYEMHITSIVFGGKEA